MTWIPAWQRRCGDSSCTYCLPETLTGEAGNVVAVNGTEDGYELITPSGTGTVTSVGITPTDGLEVDSGSPVTSAGTIALGVNASGLRSHINVEDGADVTDTTNVVSSLSGASLTGVTVATDDKVLIQDTSNSDALRTVTAVSIANLVSSGMWWEELGRTTLGVAGDTLSLPSLPAKKYLHLIWHCVAVTNPIQPVLRFNNDTGNNYAITYSQNYGALVTTVSQSNISVASAASLGVHAGEAKVTNVLADRKMVRAIGVSDANLGAANGSTQIDVTGKWANTSAQITRVDLINLSTGDFAIGSELIVLGHD